MYRQLTSIEQRSINVMHSKVLGRGWHTATQSHASKAPSLVDAAALCLFGLHHTMHAGSLLSQSDVHLPDTVTRAAVVSSEEVAMPVRTKILSLQIL